MKKTSNYAGKTYNSVEGVREFFKRRTALGRRATWKSSRASRGAEEREERGRRAARRLTSAPAAPPVRRTSFAWALHVKHAKYGNGVVLRLEGAGEDAKLTVSFPGYGLKKFVGEVCRARKGLVASESTEDSTSLLIDCQSRGSASGARLSWISPARLKRRLV